MKKIITSIITFILVISFVLPGASAKETQVFEDVPTTHPNFNDINYLVEHGVLEKGGKYRLTDMITREEAIVMIAKAVGLDGTPRETKFDDVPKSNINSGYIQSAVEAEIIYGSTPYDFMPKAPLTRMQMSVILVRAFQLPLDEVPIGTRLFKDVDYLIYGAPFIQSIVKLGITNGYPDGNFKPHNALTRAHMAAFLSRAMKYVEDNK
ncbi:S-layer homology domain-containing protein [Lysinibacillus sp. FJAT-14745]|uniref:S-layer homology domain-containing protein n=1 Tax=Lysinibacillus sp. FJAT-14745 TaxID=1704289 RepID=UPI0006ABBDE3|nr:S-layer homology domain-containing protein [Lysinibacillus sp. FJAT-14745]